MSRLLKTTMSALFIAGVSTLPAMAEQNKQPNIILDKQPNIMFIFADDQTYETISAYGLTEVNRAP